MAYLSSRLILSMSCSKKVGNKWAITLEDRNISFEGEARRKTELLHNDKTLVQKRIHFLKGFIFSEPFVMMIAI